MLLKDAGINTKRKWILKRLESGGERERERNNAGSWRLICHNVAELVDSLSYVHI